MLNGGELKNLINSESLFFSKKSWNVNFEFDDMIDSRVCGDIFVNLSHMFKFG